MAENRISVIIPTLNEETRLGGLLSQIAGTPGIEVIVSDGGSTDRTLEVCRTKAVRWVSSPAGRGAQLNSGASIAKGEVLFFLHADSQVEQRVFGDIRQAVRNGRDWGCCSLSFNEPTWFFRALAAASRLRVRLFSSCYGDQGIWCLQDLFRQTGGFPDFPFLEDLAFSRRLRRCQRAVMVAGKVITSTRRFRQHGLWITLMKMQVVKVLFRFGVSPGRLLAFYQGAKRSAD